MDVRGALIEQYRGGLAMLAQAVRRCPDDVWSAEAPVEQDGERFIIRSFWRIALHDAYFTHLYLGQDDAAFTPPAADLAVRQRADFEAMWRAPWEVEPYELAEGTPPPTKEEVLQYIGFVESLVEPTLREVDLERTETRFGWYRNMGKLSHELMNLRHLQDHVGQLSERLLARGIDIDWASRAPERAVVE